jgi:hypothetical protein
MMTAMGILLAVIVIAGFLGFWGLVGAFTAALVVIFWLALALLMTAGLVAALGVGGEAFR